MKKMAKNYNYSKTFYSGKSAFQVEGTSAGIFISLAPPSGKKSKGGKPLYDYSQKIRAKMGTNEVSWIIEGLKAFRHSEGYFRKLSQLQSREKKDYLSFFHSFNDKNTSINLQPDTSGANLYLGMVQGKDNKLSYSIQPMDWIDLENWFNFLLQKEYEKSIYEYDSSKQGREADYDPENNVSHKEPTEPENPQKKASNGSSLDKVNNMLKDCLTMDEIRTKLFDIPEQVQAHPKVSKLIQSHKLRVMEGN
jgi:hypothetical protein